MAYVHYGALKSREQKFVSYIINRTQSLCERMAFVPFVRLPERFESVTVRIGK